MPTALQSRTPATRAITQQNALALDLSNLSLEDLLAEVSARKESDSAPLLAELQQCEDRAAEIRDALRKMGVTPPPRVIASVSADDENNALAALVDGMTVKEWATAAGYVNEKGAPTQKFTQIRVNLSGGENPKTLETKKGKGLATTVRKA